MNSYCLSLWAFVAILSGISGLVSIYWNPIMFAQDLCHSQIEYLSNSIDLNLKDRAKPPLRPVSPWSLRAGLRLVAARSYASERSGLVVVARLRLGERYNKSSIVNIQFPDKSGSPLRCDRLSLSGLGRCKRTNFEPGKEWPWHPNGLLT